jgi:hypothetical protein
MANNYQQSSFAFNIKSPEERAFLDNLEERAEAAKDEDFERDDYAPRFEISISQDGWGWTASHDSEGGCFYAEEGGNVEAIVYGLQEFLAKFRGPTETIAFTWANTCSAMRPDNFGGGGVAFTATQMRWVDVDAEVSRLETELKMGR